MSIYEAGFEKLGFSSAQVLLTEDDFANPVRFRNLQATLTRLFSLGAIPILNENDTVSTLELESPDAGPRHGRIFGDNDRLSALVMSHVKADVLVILSDVDGLFTGNPARDRKARLIPAVDGPYGGDRAVRGRRRRRAAGAGCGRSWTRRGSRPSPGAAP